jgi:hypothetical protein
MRNLQRDTHRASPGAELKRQKVSWLRPASIGAVLCCMDDPLDLQQHERDRLALLCLLEELERSGTVVKLPAKVFLGRNRREKAAPAEARAECPIPILARKYTPRR